jgi:hypothetical protein
MSEPGALAAYEARTELARFGASALGVFALQLRFDADDPEEFADSITEGVGDHKADIVHVEEDFRVAVIAQVYTTSDLGKSTPPINKASDLNTAAAWIIDPAVTETLPADVRSAAALLHAAIEDGSIDTIEFWYVHNLPDSADVQTELNKVATTANALLKDAFRDLGSGIDCRGVQVGRNALDELYARRTQRVFIEDEISVPAAGQVIPAEGERWRAVCTSVPGMWLRDLYANYGGERLFSGNVRDYLGSRRSKQNINHNIETTAVSRPGDFWAFNNGVTAVVREIVQQDGALSVRGITIVNGAQTTGALASAADVAGVMVLVRLVECSDAEVVEHIIQANNTQNEIRASDFRSMDPQQRRLREEFGGIPGAHYSGARRGVILDAPPPSDVTHISADQAAQALASFHDEPQRAYHGKSKIWEDDALYARFFSDRTTAEHVVYVDALYRAINSYKRRLRSKTDRTAAEKGIYEFLSQRGAAFLLVAAIGPCQENILERSIPDRFALSFGSMVSPVVAEEHWAPIVESLASFHSSLAEAAESGRIRNDEVRNAAIGRFQAAVQALQEPLAAAVFRSFAAHVVVLGT